jgi:hypothetical protein
MAFKLRFREDAIPRWAARYRDKREESVVSIHAPAARDRGYLLYPEFMAITVWKTPRTRPRSAANSPELVREVTGIALGSRTDELKIRVLQVLDGVAWPTASVILHLCDCDRYPILDFRALWSLHTDVPAQYTFPFWWEYTLFMRSLHARTGHDMRTLDRALWQYSKENQKNSPR